MIHLDTSFLIVALRPGTREEDLLRGWLEAGEEVGLSAVAWAEFLCGPLQAGDVARARRLFPTVELLLPMDAEKGAELFNATGRRSRTLADCLIAATAVRCGADLATGNEVDFRPFVAHGLSLR